MMKSLNFKRELFDNTLIFKILWAFLVLLKLNPITRNKTSFLFIALLVYGVLLLVKDFFSQGRVVKNDYFSIVLLFLVFIALASLVNYRYGLVKNLKILVVTAIELMVISGVDRKKDLDQLKGEVSIINSLIFGIISLASLISLYLFFSNISGSYSLGHWDNHAQTLTYYYGRSKGNRLVGIFLNPNTLGAFSSIAILVALVNLQIKKRPWALKLLYYLAMALNFLALILSRSRAAQLGFFISLILFFLARLIHFFYLKNFLYKGLALLLAGSLLLAFISPIFLPTLGDYGTKLSKLIKISDKRQKVEASDDLFIKSSGRVLIWEMGLYTFKDKPVFGVGKAELVERVKENWPGNPELADFDSGGGLHNIFLETLVSYGIFTFILLLLLIFVPTFYFLKYILEMMKVGDFFPLSLLLIMVFSIVRNMAESSMLYSVSLSSYIFYLYLGLIMSLAQVREKTKNPLILASRKIEKIYEKSIHRLYKKVLSFLERIGFMRRSFLDLRPFLKPGDYRLFLDKKDAIVRNEASSLAFYQYIKDSYDTKNRLRKDIFHRLLSGILRLKVDQSNKNYFLGDLVIRTRWDNFKFFNLNQGLVYTKVGDENNYLKLREDINYFGLFYPLTIKDFDDPNQAYIESLIEYKSRKTWSQAEGDTALESLMTGLDKISLSEARFEYKISLGSLLEDFDKKVDDRILKEKILTYFSDREDRELVWTRNHGDLNFNNILLSNGEYFFIDWEDSLDGFFIYDFLNYISVGALYEGDFYYLNRYFKGDYDKKLGKVFKNWGQTFKADEKMLYLLIYVMERICYFELVQNSQDLTRIFNLYINLLEEIEEGHFQTKKIS